eukprot:TRINITY_DN2505_c0_g1_i2.p1 TRINITY_DN2505_c0_g1~~TRINITY_DN2505_c0_g1_i2.p1  ORF type:complete len:146 (+),score=16.95 TRINITY_DN2505_c0_g1_i2:413-850(+)
MHRMSEIGQPSDTVYMYSSRSQARNNTQDAASQHEHEHRKHLGSSRSSSRSPTTAAPTRRQHRRRHRRQQDYWRTNQHQPGSRIIRGLICFKGAHCVTALGVSNVTFMPKPIIPLPYQPSGRTEAAPVHGLCSCPAAQHRMVRLP